MPVQIGAKSQSFSNPTGLLFDCHRRIELFLDVLSKIAEVIDRPPTEDARLALDNALRYFRQAAPKHTADEEDSLFPRLRRSNDGELRTALALLVTLEEEHRFVTPLHASVETLGTQYLRSGSLQAMEVAEFREAVARLTLAYKEHIRLEDEIVFPLAARVLSDEAKSAIAREMAARRQITAAVDMSPVAGTTPEERGG